MSQYLKEEHTWAAEALVEESRRNDGLAPLDIDKFWRDDESAKKDPWNCPQVPLGLTMRPECIEDDLGFDVDLYKLEHDEDYLRPLAQLYNDKAERIVGKRLLPEKLMVPAFRSPEIKHLHDIFESEYIWRGQSYWLQQAASSEKELEELLDRVEKRLADLRGFLLPPEWEGSRPVPIYRSQRGPVTFAASVYGPENLIYLLGDNEKLSARFRDLILRSILEVARITDELAGFTPETAPRGWSFADDTCCLLSPELYEFFGYPILKAVFERYAPEPDDRRYQHSDSDMAHLLPILGRLGLNGVNFGPTLSVAEIREHLPRAVISGQLAPFTFSRNEEVNIVAEFCRDFEMARDLRGLKFNTAGSVNAGSRLSGYRLIMAAIQKYGGY